MQKIILATTATLLLVFALLLFSYAQRPVPTARYGCYKIPGGEIYLIKLPGSHSSCAPGDREFVLPSGPQGPAGPVGPPGPQGVPGAPGGPVNSVAGCEDNTSVYACSSICGSDSRVITTARGNCQVTSETGSCTAHSGFYPGLCCVCLP
jgi:hypothetical protein